MKQLARAVGLLSLVGTLLPPLLFMLHHLEHTTMQTIMLGSCIAWFAMAPLWMKAE